MKLKTTIVAVCAIVLLGPVSAQAATGKVKVTVKDKGGHIINGQVTAKKGSSKKICKTRLGICTIDSLALGVWSVSFASTAGTLVGGPKGATVKAGTTVSVILVAESAKEEKPKAAVFSKRAKRSRLNTSALSKRKANPTAKARTLPKKTTTLKKRIGKIKKPLVAVRVSKVPDLSKGKSKRASGTVRDRGGHLLNGSVTLKQGTKIVGQSKTTLGTYRLYDISPGTYMLEFKSSGGNKAVKKVILKKDQNTVINFRVQ